MSKSSQSTKAILACPGVFFHETDMTQYLKNLNTPWLERSNRICERLVNTIINKNGHIADDELLEIVERVENAFEAKYENASNQ